MADGTSMNQMAESIAALKKNVEKNEKVLEKLEKNMELNDLQVKQQICVFMQNTDRKFEEIMKKIAYLTQVAEKGKSSLETKQGEPMIVEANAGDKVHIQELRPDQKEESFYHLSHQDAHNNNDNFAMIPEIESMELQRGHPIHELEDERLDLSIEQIKKSRKEVQQAADPGKIQLLLEYTKLEILNKNQDLLVLDKLFYLKHHLLDESSQPSCKDLLEEAVVKKVLCWIQEQPLMEEMEQNSAIHIYSSFLLIVYVVNVNFFKHRWRWKLG
jgi:ribosomal protein S17